MAPHPCRRLGVAVVALIAVVVPATSAHATEEPVAGDSTVSPLPVGRAVGDVAHKGASGVAPENTLSAIRQGIARRANFMGIDVRQTRDGALVVLHDHSLARTTDVEQVFPERSPWYVEDFTLDEIRRLDAGSWFSPEYTGEPVPTLMRVLNEMRPSHSGLFLEIKEPDLYGGVGGIGTRIAELLQERVPAWLEPGAERLVVQAFDDSFLKEFEASFDYITVGPLGRVNSDNLADKAAWADQINVNQDDVLAEPTLIDAAHAEGLQVSTYIVNDTAKMDALLDAGVDAISTDVPARLYRLLERHGRVMAAPVPPDQPATPVMTVEAPDTAVLHTRVPMAVRLRDSEGRPARWVRVRVQQRTDLGWHTLQERVTDRLGNLRTSVTARRRMSLRIVSVRSAWFESVRQRHRVRVR